jgi:hypothetical protein
MGKTVRGVEAKRTRRLRAPLGFRLGHARAGPGHILAALSRAVGRRRVQLDPGRDVRATVEYRPAQFYKVGAAPLTAPHRQRSFVDGQQSC